MDHPEAIMPADEDAQMDLVDNIIPGEIDGDDKGHNDADTCRICRSEGTDEEPLFYPCKCSGSIKFVHQDCLMEWLAHTNKKHCELCKTPFRFTKLYDSHMPDTLPWGIFVQKACIHIVQQAIVWSRALLVVVVWLLLLPWCIRWAWSGLFFMMDAGWAREPWIASLEAEALHGASGEIAEANSSSSRNISSVVSSTYDEPLTFKWSKALWHILVNPWRRSPDPDVPAYTYAGNVTKLPVQATLLSDLDVARLTSSPWINRVIVDIMEGQIITFVVVVAFILVFLIREWVVQQQPILNAAAHVREAEQQIERFDQARRRIRGDIREAEQQIEQLDQTAHDLRQLNGDNTNQDDTAGSGNHIGDLEQEAEPASNTEKTSRMDWGSLGKRIQDASEAVQQDNGEDAKVDMDRIQELAKEALGLMTDARQIGITSDEALDSFKALIEDAPQPIQSVWQSQLLVQLRQLQSEQRLSTLRANHHNEESILDVGGGPVEWEIESQIGDSQASQRPGMPPREVSIHANQILRALEEDANASEAPIVLPFDRDANSDSEGSADSWQSVRSMTERPVEISESFSGEQSVSFPAESSDYDVVAQHNEPATRNEEETEQSESSALFPRTIEQTPENLEDMEIADTDEPTDDREQISSSADPSHDSRQADEAKNFVQRMLDWFWADIEPLAPNEFVVLDGHDEAREEVALDEVRPVHDHGVEVEQQLLEQDDEAVQDPEVVAAAAAAGIDPEAIEDAEDMEGVMELIGMQGPILGLLQTAMFCGVLVTITIWGAVGAPFLFGKLALLFIGDPVLFLVVLPMQIVANVGDVLLDAATLILGSMFYWMVHACVRLTSLLLIVSQIDASPVYLSLLKNGARGACKDALGRLTSMFTVEPTNDFVESGYLLVSIQAHKALHDLESECATIIKTITWVLVTSLEQLQSLTLLRAMQFLHQVLPRARSFSTSALSWLSDAWHALLDNGVLTLTIRGPKQLTLDPSLAYWNGADRTLTVLIGYSFIAMIGMAYLLRSEPLFTNPTLRNIEKSLADVLKQSGGVLKVILIISIEMLVFPLYCGILLDCALLPLFKGATMESRMSFASRSPYFWVFSRWFLGTCYMFHFALFVSMCRRLMRSGVLYFIRDPDDPTFHPVRDVLERNVTTQLKKIAFSALVYGALVILCLGGVIWTIAHVFPGIFPVRWASPEPVFEFPLDFLFYNFITPILFKFVKPAYGFDEVYEWWLRKSARFLRLSHFLFGERREEEEGRRALRLDDPGLHSEQARTSEPGDDNGDSPKVTSFHKDGRYVRAPASDQVRIARGETVFVEVSEEEMREGESQQDCELHGKPNQKFRNIYVPPWFRVRIGLFLFSLWLLSAAIGGGLTLLPLAIGRKLCSFVLPKHVMVNDIYAFTAGIYVVGCTVAMALNGPRAWRGAQSKLSGASLDPAMQKAKVFTLRLLKSLYLYGFAFVIVPAAFALMLQLYMVIPLHTYLASIASSSPQSGAWPTKNSTISNITASISTINTTHIGTTSGDGAPLTIATHTVHLLQDGALGFVYGRLLIRLLLRSRNSWPAAAFRQITRAGYFNPDIKLATRAFVIPTLLLFGTALAGPPLVAGLLNNVVLRVLLSGTVTQPMRTKFYRYSYPLCASQALTIWGAWEAVKATRRWRSRIRDEVYLIGERLHNFGEKKPPIGSKSVARKEK